MRLLLPLVALLVSGCLIPLGLTPEPAGTGTDDDDSTADDDDTTDDDDSTADDDDVTADDDDIGPDDDDIGPDDDDTGPDDDDTGPSDDDDTGPSDDDDVIPDDDDVIPDDDDAGPDDDDAGPDDDDAGPDDDDAGPDDDDAGPDDDDAAPNDDDAALSAPVAIINGPSPGETIRPTAAFDGVVSDPDTNVESLTISWTSNVDGQLSTSPADALGNVGFAGQSLSSGLHTITLTVEDGDGNQDEDSIPVDVDEPPSAPSFALQPVPAYTDDALFVLDLVPGQDPEGQPIVSTSYQWFLDGIEQPGLVSSLLGTSNTAAGQTWSVQVVSHDAFGPGEVAEQSVEILNSAPSTPVVSVSPASPRAGLDDLICSIETLSTDPDGTSVSYSFGWTLGAAEWTGATFPTTDFGDSIAAGDTLEGQSWSCVVSASDGEDTTDSAPAAVTISAATGFTQVLGTQGRLCRLDVNGELECWGRNSNAEISDAPDASWLTVAMGSVDICGITDANTVLCWGQEGAGVVAGVPTIGTWVDVAVGSQFACAVDSSGAVDCWGVDTEGQTTDRPPNTGWAEVHSGYDHLCTLHDDGSIFCWGDNDEGQVTGAPGGVGHIDLEVSEMNACAITALGALTCWGEDAFNIITSTPGGTDWVSVYGGLNTNHKCAIDVFGDTTCWGPGGGNGPEILQNIPSVGLSDITLLDGAVAAIDETGGFLPWGGWPGQPYLSEAYAFGAEYTDVAVGGSTDSNGSDSWVCMAAAAGGVECFGDEAMQVAGAAMSSATWTDLDAGFGFACALNGGAVTCWGDNTDGQLTGAPSATNLLTLDVGDRHACVIDNGASLSCWGANDALQVTGAPNSGAWADVACGTGGCCALDGTGTATCWGLDDFGQLALATGTGPWDEIAVGGSAVCAIDSGGNVECWGQWGYGDGHPTTGGWQDLTVGTYSACAQQADGELECWGGLLDFSNREPTEPALSEVDLREQIACGLNADGRLGCWGANSFDLHW